MPHPEGPTDFFPKTLKGGFAPTVGSQTGEEVTRRNEDPGRGKGTEHGLTSVCLTITSRFKIYNCRCTQNDADIQNQILP
jgi:hypothetical protein